MWADESSSELRAEEFVEKRLEDFHSAWETKFGECNTLIPKYDVDDFRVHRRIGQGNFCNVYSVSLIQSTHPSTRNDNSKKRSEPEYALKRLQKRFMPGAVLFKVAAADIAIESTILSNLAHENIVAMHGVKNGDMIQSIKEGSFFIVLDLLVETLDDRLGRWQRKQNRSIFQSIASKKAKVLKRINDAAMGIAKGMEYLHSLNIIFRMKQPIDKLTNACRGNKYISDLKPTNIGFNHENQVKIFDFGLAREMSEDSPKQRTRLMTGGAGTPRYMAPEVAAMSDSYGFPADVYSFTILLWQIVTTRTPYADILSPTDFASQVLKENKRPSLAQIDCSDSLKSLMESGWSADPLKRPTFSVIRHELDTTLLCQTGQQTQPNEAPGSSNRRKLLRRTMSDPIAIHPHHKPGRSYDLRTSASQGKSIVNGDFVSDRGDTREAASSPAFAKCVTSNPRDPCTPESSLTRMLHAAIRRSSSTLQESEENSSENISGAPESDKASDEQEAPAACTAEDL